MNSNSAGTSSMNLTHSWPMKVPALAGSNQNLSNIHWNDLMLISFIQQPVRYIIYLNSPRFPVLCRSLVVLAEHFLVKYSLLYCLTLSLVFLECIFKCWCLVGLYNVREDISFLLD